MRPRTVSRWDTLTTNKKPEGKEGTKGRKQKSWRSPSGLQSTKGKGWTATRSTNRSGNRCASALASSEELTRHLLEWSETEATTTTGATEKAAPASTRRCENNSISNILQAFSVSLEEGPAKKTRGSQESFSGEQRGNAVAATLHALNFVKEQDAILQMLVWCCNCFAAACQGGKTSDTSLKVRMTTVQARKSLRGLQRVQFLVEEDRKTKLEHMRCALHLLCCCASQLPAEDTSHQVVHTLKQITTLSSETAATGLAPETKYDFVLLGVKALYELLQVKKQSSALLAPLVNDVTPEGQELFLVNRIREHIFSVLQWGIHTPITSELTGTLVEHTYQCMEKALHMAADVDRTSANNQRRSLDVDAATMLAFFKKRLGVNRNSLKSGVHGKHRILILRLLLAYLKKQPESSASIGSALLFNENLHTVSDADNSGTPTGSEDMNSCCPNCCYDGKHLPCFLIALHAWEDDREETDLSMAVLAILVTNIPWKLWLGHSNTSRHGTTTSNFLYRVSDLIKSIVIVSKCLLKSLWKGLSPNLNSMALLVKATLFLPYDSFCNRSKQDQDLIMAAGDLFETLADMLTQENLPEQPLSGLFSDLFEESMGGILTPQGTKTAMIIPARTWLSVTKSRLFIDRLFYVLCKGSSRTGLQPAARTALKLLLAILRSHPKPVLECEKHWNSFQRIIQSFCDSKSGKLQQGALQLLECFLYGRMYCVPPLSQFRQRELVDFVLKQLPIALERFPGPCRRLSVQAYGSMLGSDWFLQGRPAGYMKNHVCIILNHCVEPEAVAGVRSAACKAIGDFCSNCFSSCDKAHHLTSSEGGVDGLRVVGQNICEALLRAKKDRNCAVRAMAVFALGNLAQVISCSSASNVLTSATLRDACMAGFDCLRDGNDKVCGNGIRSLAHLGKILLQEDNKDLGWDVILFCQQVVQALSHKVDEIPICHSRDGIPALSWKQRSTAKKHGRVACNTLGIFLKNWSLSEDSSDSIYLALCSAVNCLGSLGTSLVHEKNLIAASIVLRAIPPASLAHVSGKRCLVGNSLKLCISFIAREKWNPQRLNLDSSKLLSEVEALFEHLLDSASIVDASVLVSINEMSDSLMQDLYAWMVQRNCTPQVFDMFATALEKHSTQVPVTVVQKFANRAMALLGNHDENETHSDDEL